MEAIEVPMHVSFDKDPFIRLEPGNGPTAQPVLSFALSIQIPMFALVNALAEFQSKYIAEQGGWIPIAGPIAEDPEPPEPAPGSLAPSSLAGVAEKTSAPLSAGLSAVASTRSMAFTPEHCTSTQMTSTWEPLPDYSSYDEIPVASANPAQQPAQPRAENAPAQPRAKHRGRWEDFSMADYSSSDEVPVASANPAQQPAQPRAGNAPAQPRAKHDAGGLYIHNRQKCPYQ